ncbi:type II toxin-antitoxin system VapC family toxin [Parabacteroides bouchesdurhonensis]|uniref:type II toxin-antitoxin system VapC family toxin n=1 Tax=Parabacteroides bouchesdurhonensis TaxID=1936995 RepID=UPI000E50F34B|nr:PIN domain-containing protein [Parabacteroides bouchesdurhonensis]RHJ92028.1 PIN domain-containing protein [Bacteroides sp. AM07-16]
MKSLFLDTNIVVDLLAKREPFYSTSAPIFAMGDRGMVQLFICSLSFSTIFYLLRKQVGKEKAMLILRSFRKLVSVLPVNDDIVDKALQSSFTDFEDAIQYYSAIDSGIETIITRNVKDYKDAEATVMTPEEFLYSCH